MPLFSWQDDYSVHISEMDEQHKNLVGLINQLFDAMKQGKGKEKLEDILDELVKYTVYHFQAEEKMMQTNGYPGYGDQVKIHRELTAKVVDLQNKYKSGSMLMSIEILDFLKDWLTKHILGMDKEYSAFFNAKGIK